MKALLPVLFATLVSFSCARTARGGGPAGAVQYRVSELSFTAHKKHAKPALELQMEATFTGPKGSTIRMPGFWDGGNTWRVRFTHTLPGRWMYRTSSRPKDAGLDG